MPQNKDHDKDDEAPHAESVDPFLEALRIFDQLDQGLSEVQVHVNACAGDGQQENGDYYLTPNQVDAWEFISFESNDIASYSGLEKLTGLTELEILNDATSLDLRCVTGIKVFTNTMAGTNVLQELLNPSVSPIVVSRI